MTTNILNKIEVKNLREISEDSWPFRKISSNQEIFKPVTDSSKPFRNITDNSITDSENYLNTDKTNYFEKIGKTIVKGIKNSWKILPFGSMYNDWKNHQYETDSVVDKFRECFHEIYAGIPIILLGAWLYNGIANDKWIASDYKNKNEKEITQNTKKINSGTTYFAKVNNSR